MTVDDLEHLHASYFISQGLMPYRDFFEHHHPLFLFILAPFIKIMPQNAVLTLYTARTLMLMISCGTFYYLYQISTRFLGGKGAAWISLLIFMSFYPTLYMSSSVKPDTPMLFFFVCGLYYFFVYIRDLNLKPLIISATLLTISFLFLQTAIFLILPICFIYCYILYKHPQQIRNIPKAIIIPIIMLCVFAFYLYNTNSWEIYIQQCWIFNSKFFSLLNFRLPSVLSSFIVYILFGYVAYVYLIIQKKVNIFTHISVFLLTAALIKNLIFPTYYPRYLLPCFFYTSLLCGNALRYSGRIFNNWNKAALTIIGIINIIITLFIYNNRDHVNTLRIINPDDKWFKYSSIVQDIYQPLHNYYWYSMALAVVDDYLFSRQPNFNVNEFIKENNFMYILYSRNSIKNRYPIPAKNADPRFLDTYERYRLDETLLEDYEDVSVGTVKIYKLK